MGRKPDQLRASINGVPYDQILRSFLVGRKTTAEIAADIGCTHQRVGQIIKLFGVNVFRVGQEIRNERIKIQAAERKARKMREKLTAKAALRTTRRNAAEERFAELRLRWDDGQTIHDIAAALGRTPGAIAETIRRLRAKYGWFPRRRAANIKR